MATEEAQVEVALEIGSHPEQEAKQNDVDSTERAGNVNTSPQSRHTVQESLFDSDMPVPKAMALSVSMRSVNVQGKNHDNVLKKYLNGVVTLRMFRWCGLVTIPCLFLILLTYEPRYKRELELPWLLGVGIEVLYVIYFGLIAFLFRSGTGGEQDGQPRYLYRIWTRSASVKGWSKMTIAAEQRRFQLNAIESISEFSAVEGAVSSLMLANLGPVTWTMVFMHFASELAYDEVFSWDVADILEMIGVSGLVMIGMFELDPYNPGMKLFHYIGAAAGVGTIAGYVLQSLSRSQELDNFTPLIAPIIICVIAGTCFLLWQLFNKQTATKVLEFHKAYTNATYEQTDGRVLCIPCPCCKGETLTGQSAAAYKITKPPTDEQWAEIRSTINSMSIKNVVFEGIFLFCGATSLALWLMHYHTSCSVGCAGLRVEMTPSPTCPP
eukprot:CAMPEP_0202707298 /NCGR_PEP_ID=MMETSP1385-20130828/19639_1 /ASSEMBLY_ACC=CAM_ASM_000861 /TAXON_ID=933848 /ORGANISM="Elphidium margaritaceum" /LENGTH=437 /DNA_ID=CAMNT_0049365987 /DNA_START=34 /DNA_END=1347 /DNA_ORIENTATION=-